jgi:hypothetical protein
MNRYVLQGTHLEGPVRARMYVYLYTPVRYAHETEAEIL